MRPHYLNYLQLCLTHTGMCLVLNHRSMLTRDVVLLFMLSRMTDRIRPCMATPICLFGHCVVGWGETL